MPGEAAKAWLVRRDVSYAESVPSVVIAKTTITIAQALFLLIGLVLAWHTLRWRGGAGDRAGGTGGASAARGRCRREHGVRGIAQPGPATLLHRQWRRLGAMLGLIGVILATPVAARTPGIVEIGDLVLIGYPGDGRSVKPQNTRVPERVDCCLGVGEIEVVGLTVEQLEERLGRGGMVLRSVNKAGRGARSSPVLQRLQAEREARTDRVAARSVQRDVVPACPNCG